MPRKPHSYRYRGRQTFLVAGFVFVLAQLVTGLLLDYRYPLVRFPSLHSTLKAATTYPRSPDIICLGSSRSGTSFREEYIMQLLREETGDADLQVFNAAVEGADFMTANVVLDRLIDQGVKPAIVVIEVSAETLAQRNRWLRHDIERHLTWEEIPFHVPGVVQAGGFTQLFGSRLIPLYYYRKRILVDSWQDWVEANKPEWDMAKREDAPEKGPLTRGVPWPNYMERSFKSQPKELARTQLGLDIFRSWLKDYRIGGSSAECFERLIARCQSHGMKVILTAVPLSSPHRAMYTPEINAAFKSHVEQIAREHGVTFRDFRERIPDRLFQDSHHVRMEGGKMYSDILVREVLGPTWTQVVRERRGDIEKQIGRKD